MVMVRVRRPFVKPSVPELPPDACPICGGSGRIADDIPCWSCDSTGRCREGFRLDKPSIRKPASPTRYYATSGFDDGYFDQDGNLAAFVERLCEMWCDSSDHIAVWAGSNDGTRLVTVLRPDVDGEMRATYL